MQGDTQTSATHFSLQIVFEYELQHTAACMACRTVDGSSCHQIAVLSMDGQLIVLERGTPLLRRQLAGFLLPGPLCYAPSLDAFLTASSAFEVRAPPRSPASR